MAINLIQKKCVTRCVRCYAQAGLNPVVKETYGVLYGQFMSKVNELKVRYSHEVEVMWECEWLQRRKNDLSVQTFLQSYRKPERLDPREALFGGRTNAMKLYHKVSEGEKVRYYDFTSLYPAVNTQKQYPFGHPQIIYRDFGSLDKYFGFVKCDVLPPRGLFHPVLPYRCHNKLMFPLCRTCAEELNQTSNCTQ